MATNDNWVVPYTTLMVIKDRFVCSLYSIMVNIVTFLLALIWLGLMTFFGLTCPDVMMTNDTCGSSFQRCSESNDTFGFSINWHDVD